LQVDPERQYLVESRLGPVARREGFGSLADMMQALRDRGCERLTWAIVEAMSPAETIFFRDPDTFQPLLEAVQDLARRRAGQSLRIWVAACGAGQEVYSLAMLLDEAALGGVTIELCASDLSERRLEKARSGVYSQIEVQRGLSARRLVRHFEKRGEDFSLTERIRRSVRWRRVNLMDDLSPLGQFDLVACRNVLGAMTGAARAQALHNLHGVLAAGGYLVLGRDEHAPRLAALGSGLHRSDGRRGAVAA
jgi:chemotaxis protein methyltransferase CheR